MVFNLSDRPSLANRFIAELRDVTVQNDSMRFRRNLERIGEVLAYEISKTLKYKAQEIETPLGISTIEMPAEGIVLGTILRAGIPLHHGMLNYFDKAENAFISAYRKHHKDGTFEISLEYVSCPNLEGKVLILSDPMLATGASVVNSITELLAFGKPSKIIVATVIAAMPGITNIQNSLSDVTIWTGAIDEELTGKSYIVPGLGDAGDLAYGEKLQE